MLCSGLLVGWGPRLRHETDNAAAPVQAARHKPVGR
jgi:hypothetical protein